MLTEAPRKLCNWRPIYMVWIWCAVLVWGSFLMGLVTCLSVVMTLCPVDPDPDSETTVTTEKSDICVYFHLRNSIMHTPNPNPCHPLLCNWVESLDTITVRISIWIQAWIPCPVYYWSVHMYTHTHVCVHTMYEANVVQTLFSNYDYANRNVSCRN